MRFTELPDYQAWPLEQKIDRCVFDSVDELILKDVIPVEYDSEVETEA